MKADHSILEQEPIGIVISSGTPAEAPPMFSAYVWAPDPEPSDENGATLAA